MNLDAGAESGFEGQLAMKGGSLQVAAPHLGLGETSGAGQGLLLDVGRLNALSLDRLVLGSPNPVGLYGSFDLKLGSLDWRSPGAAGRGGAGDSARIMADALTLSNPYAGTAAAGTGAGSLQLQAQRITLGPGAIVWTGFPAPIFRLRTRSRVLARAACVPRLTCPSHHRCGPAGPAPVPRSRLRDVR